MVAQLIIIGLIAGMTLLAYWLLTDKDDNRNEASQQRVVSQTPRLYEASPIRPQLLSIAASRPMLKS